MSSMLDIAGVSLPALTDILSVQGDALANIYDEVRRGADLAQIDALFDSNAKRLTGNAALVAQQCVAAASFKVGFAPWQVEGVLKTLALDTIKLAAGALFGSAAFGKIDDIADVAIAALGKVLEPLLNFVQAFPVAKQIVDVILFAVKAIKGFVQAAKASQAETDREKNIVAEVVPSSAVDIAEVNAALTLLQGGDWSDLFKPRAANIDKDESWRRGWGCELTASKGRRISGNAQHAWKSDALGFGVVPGLARVSRYFQVEYHAKNASDVVDTGAFLPSLANLGLQTYALVGADGPAAFAVDPEAVAQAWGDQYIAPLLTDLDAKRVCGYNQAGDLKLRASSRKLLREAIVRSVWPGGPGDASPDEVVRNMAPTVAMRALTLRQHALLATTSVAYVDASAAPAALRERIEKAQVDLNQSRARCDVDPELVAPSIRPMFADCQPKRQEIKPARGFGGEPVTLPAIPEFGEQASGDEQASGRLGLGLALAGGALLTVGGAALVWRLRRR